MLIENVKGLKEIFPKDFEGHAKEQIKLIKGISGILKPFILRLKK